MNMSSVSFPVSMPFSDIKRRIAFTIYKKLNLRWLKYIRKKLNTHIGQVYIGGEEIPIYFEFEWSDLRNKLFIPLKEKIQNDCPYLRDEEKWDDFMSNGNVYLTNTDDDEISASEPDENGFQTNYISWYAPTLENLFAGKPLDFQRKFIKLK